MGGLQHPVMRLTALSSSNQPKESKHTLFSFKKLTCPLLCRCLDRVLEASLGQAEVQIDCIFEGLPYTVKVSSKFSHSKMPTPSTTIPMLIASVCI